MRTRDIVYLFISIIIGFTIGSALQWAYVNYGFVTGNLWYYACFWIGGGGMACLIYAWLETAESVLHQSQRR